MSIINWITHEDVEYLYLDKEILHFKDNETSEGFLTLPGVAKNNKLAFIIGRDMRENKLELLPSNKIIKPDFWTNKNTKGLLIL